MQNPFAGADRIQADGKGALIQAGNHHFRLTELACGISVNPNARANTMKVIAEFELLNTNTPATMFVGRAYSRALMLIDPTGASVNDLNQRRRNFEEIKRMVMALLGLHAHDENGFNAACAQLGMDQSTFLLAAAGGAMNNGQFVVTGSNPLAGAECYCEGVVSSKPPKPPATSPYVNLNWHPAI